MKNLSLEIHKRLARKIRVLQFGEGNFLRAFCDWAIQEMNDKGIYDGSVCVVQPLEFGRVKEMQAQDGLYTLYLKGINNGEIVKKSRIIDVLEDFINPYTEYERYLAYAKSEDLQIIISNTTESGIELDSRDTNLGKCPTSFPGKLLAFLHERYTFFKGDMTKGLGIIPCELIDNNGDELKRVLNELAAVCKLEDGFVDWLNSANHFTNTLVDRIVSGYPKNDIEQIQRECGYIDNSVVEGEIFHFWALRSEPFIEERFPAHKCGLNVVFADSIVPYKERKVRFLNGAHTALVPVAYLKGFDTVKEAVSDKEVGGFLKELIFDEIAPTVSLPDSEKQEFAGSVLERFLNPFIRHELMSIALNSTTKFRTRLLPVLLDYCKKFDKPPKNLCHAFAALILFHRGKRGNEDILLKDDPALLKLWKKAWNDFVSFECVVKTVSAWTDVWGLDLSTIHKDFVFCVTQSLQELAEKK